METRDERVEMVGFTSFRLSPSTRTVRPERRKKMREIRIRVGKIIYMVFKIGIKK